ncbi:MAG: hypothetical protein OSB58_02000 [Alphaproteobacteria bacterium]|jgi:hypothetical protein|nr:hypothetical protein [Alphaproteobacteria bacterium]
MLQIFAASIFEASLATGARPTTDPMDWRHAEYVKHQKSALARCHSYWQQTKSACLRKVGRLG